MKFHSNNSEVAEKKGEIVRLPVCNLFLTKNVDDYYIFVRIACITFSLFFINAERQEWMVDIFLYRLSQSQHNKTNKNPSMFLYYSKLIGDCFRVNSPLPFHCIFRYVECKTFWIFQDQPWWLRLRIGFIGHVYELHYTKSYHVKQNKSSFNVQYCIVILFW